jgi:hypothetical protein
MKGNIANDHRQHRLTPSMPKMYAAIHKKSDPVKFNIYNLSVTTRVNVTRELQQNLIQKFYKFSHKLEGKRPHERLKQ